MLRSVAPSALLELGIELADLGLRRFNHPLEVRPAVFELIRSERRQVAARLRAEGEAQYTTISSQADRTRDTLLAQADAEAERHSGTGPGRVHANSQRGPCPRPQVLRAAAHARIVRVDSRFKGDGCALVIEPLAEASGPRSGRGARNGGHKGRANGGGAPASDAGDQTMSRRVALALVLVAASLLIAVTGLRVVRPGERIVVRRFGRIIAPDWGPGLHWGAPLGIDRFDRVRTRRGAPVTSGHRPRGRGW